MIKISVVLPTFNRADSLLETLKALYTQTLPFSSYEVIVVDDGSTDDTAKIVSKFAAQHSFFNLRYERHFINRMKAAASNTGIRLAKGELIALLDDDTRPVPHWLKSHVDRHDYENQDVSVTGLVLYPKKWETMSNWVRYANENYRKNEFIKPLNSGGLPPNRFAGGNTSVRRDTLMRVGLFDETSVRLEDISMGCQLFESGIPLLFEKKAVVFHYSNVILSIDTTLRSFRRSYELDLAGINKKYPWFNELYGHWFLSLPNREYDTLVRYIVKRTVRFVAFRPLQWIIIKLLKLTDNMSTLYCKPLYQYVQVCEAVEGIRSSEKQLKT